MKVDSLTGFRALSTNRLRRMGHDYPQDRRRRRRAHRRAARDLIDGGTFLNAKAPRGSTPWAVAQWHLFQARSLR